MILTLDEAAVFLGIDPDTVELWEQHFGCPQRFELEHDRPGYAHEDLTSLRAALDTTSSIPAAVAVVRGTSGRQLRAA